MVYIDYSRIINILIAISVSDYQQTIVSHAVEMLFELIIGRSVQKYIYHIAFYLCIYSGTSVIHTPLIWILG